MPQNKQTVLRPTVAGTLGPVFIVRNLSFRYVHLVQKKKDPKRTVFYEYVKRKYSYADDDCICRRCDMRLHNAMKQDKEDAKGPAKTNQS